MASLLLSYTSRALLSLCRGEGIAPFMESPSYTQRATEVLLVIGALAQVCICFFCVHTLLSLGAEC
jgi:hypothetical protein